MAYSKAKTLLGIVGIAGAAKFLSSKDEEIEKQAPPVKKELSHEVMNERRSVWKQWNDAINMSAFELMSVEKKPKKSLLNMVRAGRTFRSALRQWNTGDWRRAEEQISFVKRMKGMKGPLYKNGQKTGTHLALLSGGHNPS